MGEVLSQVESTWRLLCSSFLVLTSLLIGDYIVYNPERNYIWESQSVMEAFRMTLL